MEKIPETTLQKPSEPQNFWSSGWIFAQRVLIAGGIIASLFILLAVLWAGAEVFLLIFAGLLLAIFFRALSGFLSRNTTVSETWALVIVLFLLVVGISFCVWMLAPSVEMQFSQLRDQLPGIYENVRGQLAQYPLGKIIIKRMPSPQEFMFGGQSTNLFGRVTGLFSTALNIITYSLIVLMTAVYLAFKPSLYKEGIVKLVPQHKEERAREVLSMIEITLERFLMGISVSMVTNGTLTFLGLWFLGIPFAIPLGILAGLLTFIPNIGPFIAGAPAVLVALSQSPSQGLYVLLLYLAVQNLDGFVISPLVQQRAVSLPPVIVIASQILLAAIFGFLGLLIAVPLVAVVLVLVKMMYVEDILDRKIKLKGEQRIEEKID